MTSCWAMKTRCDLTACEYGCFCKYASLLSAVCDPEWLPVAVIFVRSTEPNSSGDTMVFLMLCILAPLCCLIWILCESCFHGDVEHALEDFDLCIKLWHKQRLPGNATLTKKHNYPRGKYAAAFNAVETIFVFSGHSGHFTRAARS